MQDSKTNLTSYKRYVPKSKAGYFIYGKLRVTLFHF